MWGLGSQRVEFYSTPFVVLTGTFTGEVLCFPEPVRGSFGLQSYLATLKERISSSFSHWPSLVDQGGRGMLIVLLAPPIPGHALRLVHRERSGNDQHYQGSACSGGQLDPYLAEIGTRQR